jgi:uncharacterized protein YjbI with pentapeptide repeats
MAERDLQLTLERLGRGEAPESLSLGRTHDGRVDLRGIRLSQPQPGGRFRVRGATFDYVRSKPIFEDLVLDNIDLSGSSLENSYWRNCTFRHVRFDRLHGRGVNFASSNMQSVSFLKADLRNANWGLDGLDGPLLIDVEFVETDLRESTYGHPLFRNCRFVRCKLWRVNFSGSRFEECVFEGLIEETIFNGKDRDPDPKVAAIRNPMKNVDFSKAQLRNVSFSRGIDLTSCMFPSEGYLRIPHPRRTFQRLLATISSAWSGAAKESAKTFIELTLSADFTEEQPFHIIHPQDFLDLPWGREVGEAFLRELITASQSS